MELILRTEELLCKIPQDCKSSGGEVTTIAKIHSWQEDNPDEVMNIATKVAPKVANQELAFDNVYQKNNDTWIKTVPNPSSNQVRITIVGGEENIEGHFRLVNTKGQVIMEKEYNKNSFIMDVSNLSSGVYILFIEAQQNQYQVKIVRS